jgi:cytochrome c oxidase subunit 1
MAALSGSLLLISFFAFLYNVIMTFGVRGLIGIFLPAKLKTTALTPEEDN